jgi:hypothetical protein
MWSFRTPRSGAANREAFRPPKKSNNEEVAHENLLGGLHLRSESWQMPQLMWMS